MPSSSSLSPLHHQRCRSLTHLASYIYFFRETNQIISLKEWRVREEKGPTAVDMIQSSEVEKNASQREAPPATTFSARCSESRPDMERQTRSPTSNHARMDTPTNIATTEEQRPSPLPLPRRFSLKMVHERVFNPRFFFLSFPTHHCFCLSLSRFFSGAYCKRDRGASSSFWGKKRAACRRECLLASILILVSVAEKMASGECRMLQRGKIY